MSDDAAVVGEQLHQAYTDGYQAGNRGVPQLLAILAQLHQRGRPARGGARCRGCQHKWPCPTRRAVTEYYSTIEVRT